MTQPKGITYVVIPSNGPVEVVTIETADRLSWLQSVVQRETARSHVGPARGYIDMVGFDEVCAYVHDEGLLIGLPENGRLTALRDAALGWNVDAPPLVGPAVVVGVGKRDPYPDGEDHDVPESWRKALIEPTGAGLLALCRHLATQHLNARSDLPTSDFHAPAEGGDWLPVG